MVRILSFFMLSFVFLSAYEFDTKSFPKEFHEIDDVKLKKEEFIRVLLPIIEHQNNQILKERAFVDKFFSEEFFITLDKKMNKDVLAKLTKIAKKYNIKNLFDKKAYLQKIDVIPNSMALAQSALESGWGSSEYSKNLNNLFGHYTFRKSVKAHRVQGKREKIREFESLDKAVKQYMLNINSHWAYENFRERRADLRAQNVDFNGLEGVNHLIKYSEIGKKYIRKLETVIASSNLVIYDRFYPERKESKHLVALSHINSF